MAERGPTLGGPETLGGLPFLSPLLFFFSFSSFSNRIFSLVSLRRRSRIKPLCLRRSSSSSSLVSGWLPALFRRSWSILT